MSWVDTCQAAWIAKDLSTCKPVGMGLEFWFSLIGLSLVATIVYFSKQIFGVLKSIIAKLTRRRVPPPSRLLSDLYGRDAELDQIKDIFTTDQRVLALTNQGGIGKTALAMEYGRIHKQDGYYQDVAMIPTASDTDIVNGLRKIAADLGVADNKDPQTLIALIYDAMNADGRRWLLIFDNVDDDAARRRVLGTVRQADSIHQIITSRLTSGWPPTVATMGLDILSPDEATRFLSDASGRAVTPELEDLAGVTLGRLPLALIIAAGHLKNEPTSLKEYRDDFQNRLNDAPEGTLYDRTLHAAVMGSVDRLSEPARALMDMAAFMHPDDIFPEFFTQGLIKSRKREYEDPPDPYLGLVANSATLNAAFAECCKHSLLTDFRWENSPTSKVHRITQVVLQTALRFDAPDRPGMLVGLVAQFGWAQFSENPRDDTQSWRLCRRLAPHARYLSDTSLKPTLAQAKHMSSFVHYTALFTRNALGDIQLARHLYENNLPLALSAFGGDSQEYAAGLGNLGSVLSGLGEYEAAETHIRDAIKIDEEAGHTKGLAYNQNNLGILFLNQKKYKKAIDQFKQILENSDSSALSLKFFGTVHGNIGSAYNIWARTQTSSKIRDKHIENALTHEIRALDYTRRALGYFHFDTASCYNNISATYKILDQGDEALRTAQTALAICYAMLDKGYITDPNHPTLLSVLNTFKHILAHFGHDPSKAEEMARAEVPEIIAKHAAWQRERAEARAQDGQGT